jgi:tetratricopeptide (TPR) repeat protein
MRVNVDWIEQPCEGEKVGAGWYATGAGDPFPWLWDPTELEELPKVLRDPQTPSQFRRLVSETGLGRWWLETCGLDEEKLFRLSFPKPAWEVPWELLIADLRNGRNQATSCMVRTMQGLADRELSPYAPTVFEDPLRIAILKGDKGGRGGLASLELDFEGRAILKAWDQLESGVKKCIDRPSVVPATPADLRTVLTEVKPQLLWFSGHGQADGLLFQNDVEQAGALNWVSAKQFAEIIATAGHLPLYAVFWACSTGRAEESPSLSFDGPALFRELSILPLLSVLVVQSPITYYGALRLAEQLFRNLASGLSLETSLARARNDLLSRPAIADPMDWASPVIWSAAQSSYRLTWHVPMQPLAQLQLIGRQVLAVQSINPAELEGDLPIWADRVRSLAGGTRTWLCGKCDSAAHLLWWRQLLQEIQRGSDRYVIAIELRTGSITVRDALSRWAEDVCARLVPRDLTPELAEILSLMKGRDPMIAWKKLLSLPDICVAVSNVASGEAEAWLRESGEQAIAGLIVFSNMVPDNLAPGWTLDKIDALKNADTLHVEVGLNLRLMRVLALLNFPLFPYILDESLELNLGELLARSAKQSSTVLETAGGPIITASARQYVLEQMSPEELREAHKDCLKVLQHSQIPLGRTRFREKRLEHMLGYFGDLAAALEANYDLTGLRDEAEMLLTLCCAEERPRAMLDVLEQLGPLTLYLSKSTLLCVAWAYLRLGDVQSADFYISRIPTAALELPDRFSELAQNSATLSPADIAWYYALRAEIYKSFGQKDFALQAIEQAVAVCEQALINRPNESLRLRRLLRSYKQDRARIYQYLFYQRDAAIKIYESLLSEWQTDTDADLDVAIVLRNYSECLRSTAKPINESAWSKPKAFLQQAKTRLAKRFPDDPPPLLSEILYEEARIAEAEGRYDDALVRLEECQESARVSHAHMMAAIAKCRRFWLSIAAGKSAFDVTEWNGIQADLAGFTHGWAIRVLVNGRLKAAKYLLQAREPEQARDQLTANQETLEQNPQYNQGTDCLRIAATFVGLEYVVPGLPAPEEARKWSEFLDRFPHIRDCLATLGFDSPDVVWQEV